MQDGRGTQVLARLSKTVGRKGIQRADGICVVAGPGSFSAIRTGVLLANLLSRLFSKPLVGVTSDEAKDHHALREDLESGAFPSTAYVAPIYDAEPNITVASSHRSP